LRCTFDELSFLVGGDPFLSNFDIDVGHDSSNPVALSYDGTVSRDNKHACFKYQNANRRNNLLGSQSPAIDIGQQ
jgi:hypothetical protein